MIARSLLVTLLSPACLVFASIVSAQQSIDSAYSAQITQLTPTDTRWKFTTELVSSLPASATVPTPLKVLGYVPGTLGRLSYVAELNRYFDALAAAAPSRVKKFSLGKSEEGRESIVVAISDEANIANLEQDRLALGKLADPRGLAAAERAQIIKTAKPIYWLSGSIHSPETGSPEMLMELAYRLTVGESDWVKDIRANVITLITPVTEVDGRDRVVDVVKESRALKLGNNAVPLIYWGKYTAHDNNRDGMVMSQNLTKNFVRGLLYWHPTVVHDLHESVPFLYTSTGTGPYNDEYDPIVVDEWHTLAYQEITELTRRGLPGVWTHGFYDGWAPNYTLLAVANLHNSIGRFYETYTSSG
ncbi:MAG: M14 family zinc carboxypeptidase, partial [Gemmatimonadaceae bacterium]